MSRHISTFLGFFLCAASWLHQNHVQWPLFKVLLSIFNAGKMSEYISTKVVSGSWQWWVCCCRWCHSTCDPPHEQLLVRLEVAGGSSWCLGVIQCHCRVITCYPPSEQSCTGIEAGARWSIMVVRCWGPCNACFGGLGISMTWHGFGGV